MDNKYVKYSIRVDLYVLSYVFQILYSYNKLTYSKKKFRTYLTFIHTPSGKKARRVKIQLFDNRLPQRK